MNAGDEAAFTVLYQRYRDWVVSLARRLTGSEHLALDVMQETFLYFLGKFPGFTLTCQLKTFLYPVVRNHSLNAIGKARKLHSGTEENRHLENLAAPEVPPGASDDFDVVLSALSEDHRETLMLRFIDGLSLAEIAEATGIPLGTAKSRLHHAISKLREDPLTREFFLK